MARSVIEKGHIFKSFLIPPVVTGVKTQTRRLCDIM